MRAISRESAIIYVTFRRYCALQAPRETECTPGLLFSILWIFACFQPYHSRKLSDIDFIDGLSRNSITRRWMTLTSTVAAMLSER